MESWTCRGESCFGGMRSQRAGSGGGGSVWRRRPGVDPMGTEANTTSITSTAEPDFEAVGKEVDLYSAERLTYNSGARFGWRSEGR